jgi:ribose transport system ATP-binding protein
MTVNGLTGRVLTDVSMTVEHGEIVGVTGLLGSGASELARLIGGVEPAAAGSLTVEGRSVSLAGSTREALRGRIAYLPADRRAEGGIHALSVAENIMMPEYGSYWGKRSQERAAIGRYIRLFDIRPADPAQSFGVLSGGNQQKVLLSKWLLTNPLLLVLDDPTVGLDPETRRIIFGVLRDMAMDGTGVLMVSSEPDQLALVCDRVLVVQRGRIAAEFSGSQLTAENVALASAR